MNAGRVNWGLCCTVCVDTGRALFVTLTSVCLTAVIIVPRHSSTHHYDFYSAVGMGNESVPIQLAQCWFPGLAISNPKMSVNFSNRIYRSNFIKHHSETVMV